ncbi:hypothetical protein GGR57DRAFT_227922 [Xylariaceae sp. FL1272]|nr:hypothetical protein GGR57DRAFT_227922 [Xylariaceae sp. FL1272]
MDHSTQAAQEESPRNTRSAQVDLRQNNPASKFADPTLFPTFSDLPQIVDPSGWPSSEQTPQPTGTGSLANTWYLLAQIKENMTITKPTLIVTDWTGRDFVLLFEDNGVSLKGFRKRYTVMVPCARRTKRYNKNDELRIAADRGAEVQVIPGSLDRILELDVLLASDETERRCAACGTTEGSLLNCTACQVTQYCGKECQTQSWREMDHKASCRIIQALKNIPAHAD